MCTYMAAQKKVSRAVKGPKYVFVRLSKREIDDIVVGLNLYLNDEAALFKGSEVRVIHLRNRLQKLNQSSE